MKFTVLFAIAYCIHYISCAPTAPVTKSASEEINDAKLILSSESLGDADTILLKSIKHLLDPKSQNPTSKQTQPAPAQALPPIPPVVVITLQRLLKSARNESNQLIIENTELKEQIKNLKEEIKALKEKISSASSGYVLPNVQNQHAVPIVIEFVEQQPTNPNTYVQPVPLNWTPISHSATNTFSSHDFLRRN